MKYTINLQDVNLSHIEMVGGKNASTGEMLQHLVPQGIPVPTGFATTGDAYKKFLLEKNLDKKIANSLALLNIRDIKALNKTSAQIRRRIIATPFSKTFELEINDALKKLNDTAVKEKMAPTFAVRSSATAEDLPDASFAGQQETFLNIKGLKNILLAIKRVFASLFTSRAIMYRHDHGIDHFKIAISLGVQPMIRSDKGASGVMFTLDTLLRHSLTNVMRLSRSFYSR